MLSVAVLLYYQEINLSNVLNVTCASGQPATDNPILRVIAKLLRQSVK